MEKYISIIVPTYNRAHILNQCLQSVIGQIDPRWELIIVDDGSSDDTAIEIKPYLKDDRIQYIYQENQGVSEARNRGAELAKGDYLIFLDSDDMLYPNLISILYEVSFFNHDLICWQIVKVTNGQNTLWKPSRLEKIYNGIVATFLAGSICYKKELFNQVGGYDTNLSFGENYELGLRFSQISNLSIKVLQKPLAQYNLPEVRTSNSFANRLSSNIYLFEKHKGKFKRDPKSHSNLYYLLGYIHEQTGELKKAKFYYSRSSEIYFRNYKAHLKRLYYKIFN